MILDGAVLIPARNRWNTPNANMLCLATYWPLHQSGAIGRIREHLTRSVCRTIVRSIGEVTCTRRSIYQGEEERDAWVLRAKWTFGNIFSKSMDGLLKIDVSEFTSRIFSDPADLHDVVSETAARTLPSTRAGGQDDGS